MPTDNSFPELIRRARAGEAQAAAELVRGYEPEIRRAVHTWLAASRLRRVLDSMDICQSILANFFVRIAAGQFELERPEQLLGLLVTLARNKLRDQARELHAARRDQRRVTADGEVLEMVADGQPTASRIVAAQELLHRLPEKLPEEERCLAEQRALGRNWAEIARELGISPDAARMKLRRAVDRVGKELHLDEVEDG